MTPGPGIKPGLQWWMTKALTTAPAFLPSTEIESEIWEQANDEQNQPARQVTTEETNSVHFSSYPFDVFLNNVCKNPKIICDS